MCICNNSVDGTECNITTYYAQLKITYSIQLYSTCTCQMHLPLNQLKKKEKK